MMSYEEYKDKAVKDLRDILHVHPSKDIDDYISHIEPQIRESYESNIEMIDIYKTISPSGFVWSCAMLYPDYP